MTALAQRFGFLTQTRITIIRYDGVALGDSWRNPEYMGNLLGDPEVREALAKGTAVTSRDVSMGSADTFGIGDTDGRRRNRMLYAAAVFPGETEESRESAVSKERTSVGHLKVGGVVRVGMPLTEIYFMRTGMIWTVLSAGVLAVLVSFLVGLRMSRNITAPVEAMTVAASRMAKGDVDDRLVKRAVHEALFQTPTREIWELADALGIMAANLKDRLAELEQSKTRLETVLEHMVSGVILLDREARLILANHAAEKMLGFKTERFVGRPHLEATRSKKIGEAVRSVLGGQAGESRRLEVRVSYPEQRSLQVFVAKGSAPLEGVLVVLQDITEIRRLEAVRADFIANVSHELKTPTTALVGFAETLLGGALSDRRTAEEFVRIIYDESVRLTRLVDDLLELSRLESDPSVLRRSHIDIGAKVKAVVEKMLPRTKSENLTLDVHVPGEPVMMDVDPDRIEQVIINLVENSIKYSRPGGRIEVSVKPSQDRVRVEVRDTGIGIPLADQPRVFERFYRVDKDRSRRKGGTGLGLAIVKHIVEAHGGTVDLRSELGVGTTVAFTLPISQNLNTSLTTA